jgi:micrococcal nuclease
MSDLLRWLALSVLVMFVVWLCGDAHGQTTEGKAYVLDGDTIRLGSTQWRLDGVNAPELFEPYGQTARQELIAIIDIDRVTCVWNGTITYKRYVGICSTVHYPDIGAELIRRGLALDCTRYSNGRYRHLEPREIRKKLAGKRYC